LFTSSQYIIYAEVMFTASRKNKVWAIFTPMLALTLTVTLLTLNPNDAVSAVTINYSLFLRLAVNVTTAYYLLYWPYHWCIFYCWYIIRVLV